MAKIAFETHNFRAGTLTLIGHMDAILTQYGDMGYTLTIRQLYYQLVSRDILPNSLRSYKRTVDIAGKARLAGLLDWSAIEDRARGLEYLAHWTDPAHAGRSIEEQFRIDRWINQPNRVEIMLEKDALTGILGPVCEDLDVRLWPNKGYASLSMMKRHGARVRYANAYKIKEIHMIYFGDHDPSGMDMDRDIVDRVGLFSYDTDIHFERVALTMNQVEEYDPPPQWAKATDSRSAGYRALYGDDVWELDALEPNVLAEVAEEAILQYRDEDLHGELMEMEDAMREDMTGFAEDYQEKIDIDDVEYIPFWYRELAGYDG